ncbi:hypothetical protein [Mesobacillus maritimus]|uniref:Uncharacterized protein n=1 Tax=Mesobacillus maritimus TaxID=1643336 RepID=A0ABS7KAE8_9BACI|nr:hypothetical protein [Mesobacillus maritimus]MBY0099175.1 hypothetical protein [Mesobacillus maritimus]
MGKINTLKKRINYHEGSSVVCGILSVKNEPKYCRDLAAAQLLALAISIHMLYVPQVVPRFYMLMNWMVRVIFSVPPIFEVPFMMAIGMLPTRIDHAILVKIASSQASLNRQGKRFL